MMIDTRKMNRTMSVAQAFASNLISASRNIKSEWKISQIESLAMVCACDMFTLSMPELLLNYPSPF